MQLLTSVPLHGFQRSTAAALCDLTTEVLRTINATENAMVEYGLSEPADRSHLVGTDVKQADDAFRELEENVSFKHELHPSFPPNLPLSEGQTKPTPPPGLKHGTNVWTGFKSPAAVSQTGLSICETNWFQFGSSTSNFSSGKIHFEDIFKSHLINQGKADPYLLTIDLHMGKKQTNC